GAAAELPGLARVAGRREQDAVALATEPHADDARSVVRTDRRQVRDQPAVEQRIDLRSAQPARPHAGGQWITEAARHIPPSAAEAPATRDRPPARSAPGARATRSVIAPGSSRDRARVPRARVRARVPR